MYIWRFRKVLPGFCITGTFICCLCVQNDLILISSTWNVIHHHLVCCSYGFSIAYLKSSFIGTDFGLFNRVCHSQVHDIGDNHNINICQICLLCQWHAYGRTVGKKSCVHILFGAYSRLAALIYVSVLFPHNLCVSTFFYIPISSVHMKPTNEILHYIKSEK